MKYGYKETKQIFSVMENLELMEKTIPKELIVAGARRYYEHKRSAPQTKKKTGGKK
jgi:hypothetical protein